MSILAMMTAAAALSAAEANEPTPGIEALRPAFENTLVTIHADGRRGMVWLSRDGSYRARGRRGANTSGVWRVETGQLCMSQRRPIPIPVTYCTPIVRGGVGARWPARSVTGEAITIELVAGRDS